MKNGSHSSAFYERVTQSRLPIQKEANDIR